MLTRTQPSRLLLRSAFVLGIVLLLLALTLSFTLPMASHDRFAVTAPVGLIGAVLARWAKGKLAALAGG